MKIIDKVNLDKLSNQAKCNDRKRQNYCYHDGDTDTLQRMINAFEPNTYVRPHRHKNPDKREVFVILRGRLLVMFFNDDGKITEHVVLDSAKGLFAVEIAANEWHSATGLDLDTVVYEIKDGPYIQSADKTFATWAPAEGAAEANAYLHACLQELGITPIEE